jgi:nucleotide-binding universal stress UspA family protein
MRYKDILVFLDASQNTDGRVQLAITLAQRYGARVVGVDVSPPSAYQGEWRGRALAISNDFEAALKISGVKGEYRVAGKTTARWVDFYAYYADLIIATQHDPALSDVVPSAIPDGVLLSAGVPMLILPSEWRPEPVGESVVVAWSASREAARAVHDALPILRKARQVTLFTFGLMADHLRQHDITAEPYRWPDVGDMTPVSALFACLDQHGADLIVAGAYSHSRLREEWFGGASRDLLTQPTMPILMSH